jgi:hypothetical protein
MVWFGNVELFFKSRISYRPYVRGYFRENPQKSLVAAPSDQAAHA